jgi:hypothetical protein
VVLAGLQEYQFQQEAGGGLSREDLVDSVRRSIQRATALTQSDLKKGVNTLATIGTTAPFVGLLGTVVGVINAFNGIAATGSGGIGAVSQGIWKRSSRPRSVWSWHRRSGSTTTTAGSTTSTSRWTTRRRAGGHFIKKTA